MNIPEEYKIAIERQEKESDRYWKRSNIMLLVQGALISFFIGLDNKDGVFGILTCIEGFTLAVIWLAVLSKGKRYISRWDYVIRHIEKKCETEDYLFFPLSTIYSSIYKDESSHRIFLFNKSTTKLMQYVVVSIIMFWISLVSISLTIGLDKQKNESSLNAQINNVSTITNENKKK